VILRFSDSVPAKHLSENRSKSARVRAIRDRAHSGMYAGGGGRTRTEVALQRILSRLSALLGTRFYHQYFQKPNNIGRLQPYRSERRERFPLAPVGY